MKLKGISKQRIQEIAESFADYPYAEGEEGLFYRCRERWGIIEFVSDFVRACDSMDWIHTCSEEQEGYVALSRSSERKSFFSNLYMTRGFARGMGYQEMQQMKRDFRNAGPSEQMIYEAENKPYLMIEFLAVRKEFQKMGCMGKLLQIAFDEARELQVPLLATTDAEGKLEKYLHYGFELRQTRRLSEHSTQYDMVWFPQKVIT